MAKLLQFSESHPKPAFSEKKQRGHQDKLFKSRPKSTPRFKGPRALLKFVSTNTAKTGEDFGGERGSKSAPMAKLWQFLEGHPKPAFFRKRGKGGPREIFQKSPKSSPRLKGKKALWRKLNYTLIKMHLKCKDWRIFWRKQRLQKCPNGQVMAIIASSHKSRIFWKRAKGGPREIFQKSPKK